MRPGVEETDIMDALGGEPGDRRLDHLAHDAIVDLRGDDRRR
jgi:hypothetical protein